MAGNTTAYGYDDSDRLTSAVTENPLDVVSDDYAYDYEQVGNRVLEIVNSEHVLRRLLASVSRRSAELALASTSPAACFEIISTPRPSKHQDEQGPWHH